MNALWQRIGKAKSRIASLEDKVLEEIAPKGISNRVTPFIESGTVNFGPGELVRRELPLVQSANRITYISELSFQAFWVDELTNEKKRMTSLPKGLWGENSNNDILFDFKWNFSLGSTEREYVASHTEFGENFLSRESLGYLDNNNCLLFSKKNPLVLETNEFFKLRVVPLRRLGVADTRIEISFFAAGWRVMSEN